MDDLILEARQITHTENRENSSVQDINFSLKRGEAINFLDSHLPQESLLLRILSTLEEPQGGELVLFGEKINYNKEKLLRQMRRRIGYVAADTSLVSNMTLGDNISLYLRFHFEPAPAELEQYLKAKLELFGLAPFRNLRPHQVEHDIRRRTVYLRELIKEPELIIFNKPTTDLSSEGQTQLQKILAALISEGKAGIVLSSDAPDFFLPLVSRVLKLRRGRLAGDYSREEIAANLELLSAG